MKKIKSVKLKAVPQVELYKEESDSGKVFYKSVLGTITLSEDRLIDFKDSLEIEYGQERKKIIVEVEYEDADKLPSVIDDLHNFFDCSRKAKVTELPEVFTREDMVDFAKHYMGTGECDFEINLEIWLSKRSLK